MMMSAALLCAKANHVKCIGSISNRTIGFDAGHGAAAAGNRKMRSLIESFCVALILSIAQSNYALAAAGDDKKTFGTALVATKSHTPSTHITQCDSQAQLQLCTHTHAHMRCGMYYLYLSITSTMRPKMDPLNKRRSNNHWKAEKWIRRGSRLPITIFFFEKKRSSEVVHADLLGTLALAAAALHKKKKKDSSSSFSLVLYPALQQLHSAPLEVIYILF